MTPLTGVIDTSDPRVQWLVEDIFSDGVDIDYLEHIQERREELVAEGVGKDEIDSILDSEMDLERGTLYYGFRLDPEDGMYEEDPDAELSCIMRENVIQITKSPITAKCKLCSPCYPNQGDLGSLDEEGGYYTYTPRPEDGEEEE